MEPDAVRSHYPGMARTKAAPDLPAYRTKRDFTVTSEPSGDGRKRRSTASAPIFVVQKHAARRLHWDFRLEHGGVLWSWAVPKGPSADPADKRLAVRVEDHPLDYADFEGTIPEGQYGAGSVETWDRGTWEPRGDPVQGLAGGELKFTLHGQRLAGGYVLIRLKPRPKERGENWLLIKEHDPNEHPGRDADTLEHKTPLTHPDRLLWPGITKQDLADYWNAVAEAALAEIANRPLALVRCPEGIDGEHFFQKHRSPGFPAAIEAGEVDGAPYLFIRDAEGLRACAQMSAIELHGWGAGLADPLHPDRMVFDLDPGEGVQFDEVVQAAVDLRKRLDALKLVSFCRTTGGKGLHLVVPLAPAADWETVRAFCKSFAEAQVKVEPERFVSTVPKERRKGKILIDWLRNGLGSTAVVSFSPRARPGACVATRLHWREVKPGLDPAAFDVRTVPERLRKQRADPWAEFGEAGNTLPDG